MQVSYHKGQSHELGREMEYKRYGYAGRPVVVFPTSKGRFYQFEDSGAIAAIGEFIDTGRIQVWTLDGIDDVVLAIGSWKDDDGRFHAAISIA